MKKKLTIRFKSKTINTLNINDLIIWHNNSIEKYKIQSSTL